MEWEWEFSVNNVVECAFGILFNSFFHSYTNVPPVENAEVVLDGPDPGNAAVYTLEFGVGVGLPAREVAVCIASILKLVCFHAFRLDSVLA